MIRSGLHCSAFSVSTAVAFAALSAAACGSGAEGGDPGNGLADSGPTTVTGGDAGTTPEAAASDVTPPIDVAIQPETPPGSDPGKPSDTYPAFPIDGPTLSSAGGALLDKASIVTVTWLGDGDAAKLEDFGDKLASSKYFANVVTEYGIGPATSGAANHVRIPTKLTTFKDTDAAALVAASADAPTTSGWPAPTAQTLYVLYVPPGLDFQIDAGGGLASACKQGIGGYHTAAKLKDGTLVSYAVIASCKFFGGRLNTATSAASHEIAEAVTDAQPRDNPAFHDFDDAHLAWSLFQGFASENGDDCEFYQDSFIHSIELGYAVQRQWSNVSFAAGHAPCVPVPSAPYFNVAPLNLKRNVITVNLGGGAQRVPVHALNVKVGETGTLDVGFYSDAALGPWTLSAVEGNGLPSGGSGRLSSTSDQGNLTVSVDNTRGQNGNKAVVTIKVNAVDAQIGANLLTLLSTDDSGTQHYFPLLVSSN